MSVQHEPRYTDETILGDPRQVARLQWIKDRIVGRAVDVGIGNGWPTNFLGAAVGVEIREDRVAVAQESYPHINFHVLDASREALYGFDTVILAEVIEHMPHSVAKKMLALWSEDSPRQLLITTPNAGKEGYDDSLVVNPEHIWYPTAYTLQMLIPHGYRITEMDDSGDFILVDLRSTN